ncbi:ubiquinol-cytochrome C reductase [Sphingomonas sp. Sph1(2015)]|jgi:predicted RNA-binding protein with PUA-like domain|uniref:EVE domain-containing protein n=1 Tax=Sphingomonas sp. Sph1(2015) TaxID=1628084 RepID=UPI00097891A1|nr:EVE domain-containing protein [Sphingomonas sp. Sph1(2015)]OMJ31236.1 ubiquinol-cytochrome C reductase [Sphingomonas sp. Sph1(2015)]
MAYWLLKSEPDSYGWDDLVRDGRTEWDGVRNAAAAGHLRAMQPGDSALFYHSGKDKAAVGIATITRAAKPDGDDGRWVSVEIAPDRPLPRPVTLAAMKEEAKLAALAMLRQSRLSISPVGEAEWAVLMAMAEL